MTKSLKYALLATTVMNIFGAAIFSPFGDAIRQFYGFPGNVHPLYLWLISSWIFFFGLCYLWLGITERRELLFLVIASAGKISFTVFSVIYWALGEVSALGAIASLPDLLFGVFFLFNLRQKN